MIRNRRRKREAFLPWLQLALDLAVIYGLLYGVFWARFESGWYPSLLAPQDHFIYFKAFHLIALITVFFLRYYGLYQNNARLTFAGSLARAQGDARLDVGAHVHHVLFPSVQFF